jgi:flavin-dependent dehydrogenase
MLWDKMTMQVAIIGGNLQGLETAYLANKAGCQVLLIDKGPQEGALVLYGLKLQPEA